MRVKHPDDFLPKDSNGKILEIDDYVVFITPDRFMSDGLIEQFNFVETKRKRYCKSVVVKGIESKWKKTLKPEELTLREYFLGSMTIHEYYKVNGLKMA